MCKILYSLILSWIIPVLFFILSKVVRSIETIKQKITRDETIITLLMNLLFLTRSNQIPPYCFVRTLQGFFLGHYWHGCYVGYVTFTNWRNSKIGTNFYKTYSLEVQTVLRTRKTCKTRILFQYTQNSKTAIHQRYKRKFFWELL